MSDLFGAGGSAVFSECGTYRYELHRRWGSGPSVAWLMMNPSTADADRDDPTMRRCTGFTRALSPDAGGFTVVNLFAYRSPYPKVVVDALARGVDIVGPDNDETIVRVALEAPVVVCGWGAHPLCRDRGRQVGEVLRGAFAAARRAPRVVCLGRSRAGAPRHPLMLPKEAAVEEWSW